MFDKEKFMVMVYMARNFQLGDPIHKGKDFQEIIFVRKGPK